MQSHQMESIFDKMITDLGLNKEDNISNKAKLTSANFPYLNDYLYFYATKKIGQPILQKIVDLTVDYAPHGEDKSENINTNSEFTFDVSIEAALLAYALRDEKYKLLDIEDRKSNDEIALQQTINNFANQGSQIATLNANELEELIDMAIGLEYPYIHSHNKTDLLPFKQKAKRLKILSLLFGDDIANNLKYLHCTAFDRFSSSNLAAFIFTFKQLNQINKIIEVLDSGSRNDGWRINLSIFQLIKPFVLKNEIEKAKTVAKVFAWLFRYNLCTQQRANFIVANADAIDLFDALDIRAEKKNFNLIKSFVAYMFDKLMPYVMQKQQEIISGTQPFFIPRPKSNASVVKCDSEVGESTSINADNNKLYFAHNVYTIAEKIYEKFADDDVNNALGIKEDNSDLITANLLKIYKNDSQIGQLEGNQFCNYYLKELLTDNLALIHASEYYEEEYNLPVRGGYRKKEYLQIWDFNQSVCLLNIRSSTDNEEIIYKTLSNNSIIYFHDEKFHVYNFIENKVTNVLAWQDELKTCCQPGLTAIIGELSVGFLLKTTQGLTLLNKSNNTSIDLKIKNPMEAFILPDETIVYTVMGSNDLYYVNFNKDLQKFSEPTIKKLNLGIGHVNSIKEDTLIFQNNYDLYALNLAGEYLNPKRIFKFTAKCNSILFTILKDDTVAINYNSSCELYKLKNLKNYLTQTNSSSEEKKPQEAKSSPFAFFCFPDDFYHRGQIASSNEPLTPRWHKSN